MSTPSPGTGHSVGADSPTGVDSSIDLAAAFTAEHREIDNAIERFLADPEDTDSLHAALGALRRHIYLEEQFMFPPLREGGLVMPIMVMLREHGELWRAMASIEAAVFPTAAFPAAGCPGSPNDGSPTTGPLGDVATACRQLLAMLADHNAKEEPIIYPRAAGDLDAADAAELTDELAGGAMPTGWVCATS